MKIFLALIISLFVLFPFGQLNRLSLASTGFSFSKYPEANLYLLDLMVAGIGSCWLISKLVRKNRPATPILAKPIFLFSIIAFLSLVFNSPLLSSGEVVVAGLYLFRWFVYALFYFALFDLLKSREGKKAGLKKLLPNLLIGAGVVSAGLGLLQYFFIPNLKFLKYLNWDPHYYRLVGTFLDPAFLGMILVFTLILLAGRLKKFPPPIGYLLFGLVYLALALTYSRSSYLAYLVGMGVIGWVKKAPAFLIIIILIGGLTLLVLPQPAGEGGQLARTYTIEARIRNWQQSAKIAGDNLLLGVGFNAYRYAQRDYGFLKEDWKVSHAGAGADSSFLFILATTGIFGFAAYLWFWREVIRITSLEVKASGLALITHSLFNNSLFYIWIMIWFWTLLTAYQEKIKENS